jgi:N-acyl-D-amino-acid deacylase
VTPGFVDIHTHYDGQFLWDDRLDPSFSHGVTTAIAGNCGVGFAPVNEHRQQLIELMEGVEDIPGIVLDEGLDWRWRSFPDYLDRLDARSYTMDIAANMTHAPLRVFVMGERALRHEQATSEDIATMCDMVREGMAAGAVGFSNGRLVEHMSSRGAYVPGTFAEDEELFALAGAMGQGGHGVFQLIPKGAIGAVVGDELGRDARITEHRRIEAIARAAGRPLTYTVTQFSSDVDDMRAMIHESDKAVAAGLAIRPQISARGVASVYTLDAYHIFLRKPSYRAIAHLPRKERATAMRDPAVRAAILLEDNVDGDYAKDPFLLGVLNRQQRSTGSSFVLSNALDFEPGPERQVSNLAAAAGKTCEECVYDHFADGEGDNFTVGITLNYTEQSLDHLHGMLGNPNVISGLADGGAHMRIICDASMPTFQLAFWARDRKRGPRLSVEAVVRKMSMEPAALYGMSDRGLLEVGRRADINVIDHDRLSVGNPRIVHDLPSGAGRLLQTSEGYLATFVNGVLTRRNDAETGARPGRLVRSGRSH